MLFSQVACQIVGFHENFPTNRTIFSYFSDHLYAFFSTFFQQFFPNFVTSFFTNKFYSLSGFIFILIRHFLRSFSPFSSQQTMLFCIIVAADSQFSANVFFLFGYNLIFCLNSSQPFVCNLLAKSRMRLKPLIEKVCPVAEHLLTALIIVKWNILFLHLSIHNPDVSNRDGEK